MSQHTILISDKFDAKGVERLKANSSFSIDYANGYNREQLLQKIGGAHGLIIRSTTKVDAEALAKATNLKVVIRAGVGVDNIDIPEASRRGVIVMNAPGGNSVSTAEQALALLLASARNIAQANASMKNGQWEKTKFKGVEITGKTLGVVGLGRIGKEVVRRAKGLRMKVIGFDPFIPPQNLADLEIEIVSREEIIEKSDFITVHTPLTESTKDFINLENLSRLKKGVRLINCARGGIYNETALKAGLESGQIGSVALDVFTTEPVPADFTLLGFENCIMTPHLGASTDDAEFAVAMETVDEMIEFFATGVARNSLNFPTLDPETLDFLKPYYTGGETVGRLLGQLLGGDVVSVDLTYRGEIAKYMVQPVNTAILRGLLGISMGDQVNYVNAPFLAKDRKIKVNEIVEEKTGSTRGFTSAVEAVFTSSSGEQAQAVFTSLNNQARVVVLQNVRIEFVPAGILLVVQNKDVPGVVGTIGTFLGKKGINIASLDLSREALGGTAHNAVTIDTPLSPEALSEMQTLENVIKVVQVDLR